MVSTTSFLCHVPMQSCPARPGCGPFQNGRPQLPARRPVVARASSEPILRKPELTKPVLKPEDEAPEALSKAEAHSPATSTKSSGVTIEYQRSQAKAMQQYFRDLNALKTAEKAKTFGWTSKNEISNGRWVMFGVFVGLLTEYATGVDFINQLKLMVSYLGIADIYD